VNLLNVMKFRSGKRRGWVVEFEIKKFKYICLSNIETILLIRYSTQFNKKQKVFNEHNCIF